MKSKTTVKAYAKINLYLDITGKLENGYHTLNTVMQSISVYDSVTVEKKDANLISINVDNPEIPCDERNIAYKAARIFFSETGIEGGALINIKKGIPVEAGLGGSSADGAAVLKALNEMHGNMLSGSRLLEMAEKLGADVPFCMVGGTKLCGGTGGHFFDLPDFPDCFILIVKPDFSCGTAEAYRKYDNAAIPVKQSFESVRKLFSAQDLNKTADGLYNVFRVLYNDTRINAVIKEIKKYGALNAEMTGSGSAVFGIFDDYEKAENAKNYFKNKKDCCYSVIAKLSRKAD